MEKAVQLFEQDFARWDLHIPAADVAARASGMIRQAGWHVFYDFGKDARGEFLDYYAGLRDGTDPAVTDDWHVRLYDAGDRVPLPTVLEAYMYSRDPRPDELARARRKFADAPAQTAGAQIASGAVASPQPASSPPARPPASPRPAPIAPPRPVTKSPPLAPAASASLSHDVGLDVALAGVEAAPGGDSFASWLLTPALGSPPIVPMSPASEPRIAPAVRRATPSDAMPDLVPDVVAEAEPVAIEAVEVEAVEIEAVEIEAVEIEAVDIEAVDIEAVEMKAVEIDAIEIEAVEIEAVEIEPASVEPAAVEPALIAFADAAPDVALDMPAAEADARPADDDAATSLVFVVEPPTERVSDRTTAITLDDDALAISDDDAPREDVVGSIPPASERQSLPAPAMVTTDIAAVAGSFEPWWYRPATRRIAMVAAAVIAIIIAGSVVTHHSADASSAARAHADAPAPVTHAVASPPASPANTAAADQPDASATGDSTAQSVDTTPDSLPVASAPSSVSPESANPPADDGIARPAGPQSVPPIQQSGTSRATHGSGRTTDKTGFAQH